MSNFHPLEVVGRSSVVSTAQGLIHVTSIDKMVDMEGSGSNGESGIKEKIIDLTSKRKKQGQGHLFASSP